MNNEHFLAKGDMGWTISYARAISMGHLYGGHDSWLLNKMIWGKRDIAVLWK